MKMNDYKLITGLSVPPTSAMRKRGGQLLAGDDDQVAHAVAETLKVWDDDPDEIDRRLSKRH